MNAFMKPFVLLQQKKHHPKTISSKATNIGKHLFKDNNRATRTATVDPLVMLVLLTFKIYLSIN